MLYVWYDNEFGYSHQVIRILQYIAGLELPAFRGNPFSLEDLASD